MQHTSLTQVLPNYTCLDLLIQLDEENFLRPFFDFQNFMLSTHSFLVFLNVDAYLAWYELARFQ